MGKKAFDGFLVSIQAQIGTLKNTVAVLERQVVTYTKRADAGNQQAASNLVTTQAELDKKKVAIEELKTFFIKMKKEWAELKKRVIGYVIWAPPISVLTPPHGYTTDVCVIRLNKKKSLPNFGGNVLDLGACADPPSS